VSLFRGLVLVLITVEVKERKSHFGQDACICADAESQSFMCDRSDMFSLSLLSV
jgi:hypothetical protein